MSCILMLSKRIEIFSFEGKCLFNSCYKSNGTILKGVTRKSIIEIATDHGYQVEERAIEVDELGEADEVFCSGTAVGVASVGSITYRNKRMEFKTEGRLVSKEFYSTLVGLQTGRIEDKNGWTVEIV